MIVSTGKLRRANLATGNGDLVNNRENLAICYRTLEDFFKIPVVPGYWMEVSDTPQRGDWVAGEVMAEDSLAVCWRFDGGPWRGLYAPAERFLRRHFKLSKKPKRLWCRLVYET